MDAITRVPPLSSPAHLPALQPSPRPSPQGARDCDSSYMPSSPLALHPPDLPSEPGILRPSILGPPHASAITDGSRGSNSEGDDNTTADNAAIAHQPTRDVGGDKDDGSDERAATSSRVPLVPPLPNPTVAQSTTAFFAAAGLSPNAAQLPELPTELDDQAMRLDFETLHGRPEAAGLTVGDAGRKRLLSVEDLDDDQSLHVDDLNDDTWLSNESLCNGLAEPARKRRASTISGPRAADLPEGAPSLKPSFVVDLNTDDSASVVESVGTQESVLTHADAEAARTDALDTDILEGQRRREVANGSAKKSKAARKGGDSCRFSGVRAFVLDAETNGWAFGPFFAPERPASACQQSSIDVPQDSQDSLSQGAVGRQILVPGRDGVPTTTENEQFIRNKTAQVFVDILERELAHANRTPSFNWPALALRSGESRQLCDNCLTSIFSGYWFCGFCGKELCMDCYESEWPLEDAVVRRCASSDRNSFLVHGKPQFLAITKIPREKLSAMVEAAKRYIAPHTPLSSVELGPISPDGYDFLSDTMDFLRIGPDYSPEASFEAFVEEWFRTRPVVCTISKDVVKADWSPAFFVENFGDETPNVVDCATKGAQSMRVADFFAGFDSEANRKMYRGKAIIWKLPDWPTKMDFKDKLPAHFLDYEACLPFPRYTTRTGDRNLAARLPKSNLPPDLGPKMYIAYGSPDSVGTTPLHLDMADAVNIMMYARHPERQAESASLVQAGAANDPQSDAPPGVAA
ncbi:hypothetical protein HK405_007804, partial [Cladochytrium tenue]